LYFVVAALGQPRGHRLIDAGGDHEADRDRDPAWVVPLDPPDGAGQRQATEGGDQRRHKHADRREVALHGILL
jgi:hypothetical protein